MDSQLKRTRLKNKWGENAGIASLIHANFCSLK